MAEEEIEYESDPEEAKLSLKLRRREASDEEDEGDPLEQPPRRIDDSDGESEGAAGEDGEELDEEDDVYDLDEEEYVEEIEQEEEAVADVVVERAESGEKRVFKGDKLDEKKVYDNDDEVDDGNSNVAEGQHDAERKEIEPFAVPTAGAFYMHDDRFRDNADRGRHRRTLGGRKLWESKDDRKWGHDKYEQLSVQERHHEQGRRGSRGRFRGRSRYRGTDGGPPPGSRPKEYVVDNNQKYKNQSTAPKGVRGRGPQRYQPAFKNNNEAPITHGKNQGKPIEKHSHVNYRRTGENVTNTKPDVDLPVKQVASNLSSASPPFYPVGSSTKDNTVLPKRDTRAGIVNQNGMQLMVDQSFTMAQSTTTIRGKHIVDGLNNLSMADSPSVMVGKPSNKVQMSPSGSSFRNPPLRGQGRGLAAYTHMAYQPVVSDNQLNRVSQPSQQSTAQRNPGQNRAQSSPQGHAQQFVQRSPSGTQGFSPPKGVGGLGAVHTFESADLETVSESNQSKTALVAKGKGNVQDGGKSSFLYGGAQVMGAAGNMGSGHNDQNFPAFLPVMQFGGQHPGGIGVPAVGMAFPGYVGQPQLGGLGSSEMTWLPVLAGAAGALGASYCPPYLTVDGSYDTRSSAQSSSIPAASSKDNNTTKVGNDWKPAQRPEPANDDSGQRQKNPRRYTEMKFDQ